MLFKSLLRSSLEYAHVVWDGCSESDSNLLESLQIEGPRFIIGALKDTNSVSLFNELSWVDLSVRKKIHKLSLMYKMVFKLSPPYLCDLRPDFVFTDLVIVSILVTIPVHPTFVLIGIKNRFSFHQLNSGTVFRQRHACHLL